MESSEKAYTQNMVMGIGDMAQVAQGLVVSGRGAGARRGDWELRLVESADISDDHLQPHSLRTISIERNARTEKHLLRPYDVLVTARSHTVKVALVPPAVSRTVAASTLLVVRTHEPELGVAHFLWYYLTSRKGRSAIRTRVRLGASIPSLPASALAEIDLPMPSDAEVDRYAELVDASEAAYAAALEAARLRRETLRDAIINDIGRRTAPAT